MTDKTINERGFAGIVVVLVLVAVLVIGAVIYIFSDTGMTDYNGRDNESSLHEQSKIVPTVSDSDDVSILEDELDATDLDLDTLDSDLEDLESELNSL